MKLYATTTSERASKGQGGQWLDIEIKNEQKRLLGMIMIREKEKDSASVEFMLAPDVEIKNSRGELKGKSQKGETQSEKFAESKNNGSM